MTEFTELEQLVLGIDAESWIKAAKALKERSKTPKRQQSKLQKLFVTEITFNTKG